MDQIQNSNTFDNNLNELFIIKNYSQRCNIHGQRLDILQVDNHSSEQMLKCIYCIQGKSVIFLPLKCVLEGSTFLKGWPILDDSKIYEQLLQIPKKDELLNQYIQDVQNFYKFLKHEINLLIDKKEKDSLMNIQKRCDSFEYPLDLYDRISQKEKLKDIIINQCQDFHNQNQAFSQIVKENLQKQEAYIQEMNNSLNTFQSYKVDLVSQNQTKNQIIQLINQINDFSIGQENRNILPVSQNLQDQGNSQMNQIKQGELEMQDNVENNNIEVAQNDLPAQDEIIEIDSLQDLDTVQNFQNIVMDFRNKNIQDEQLKQIAGALDKCQNISSLYLDLDENNFKLEGVKYISTSLQKCHQMSSLKLYLSNNGLNLEAVQLIAQSLQNCQNLTQLTLYLNSNNLNEQSAKYLAQFLEKSQSLTKLDLGLKRNNIQDPGAIAIVQSLESCQNINELKLYLGTNNLQLEGIRQISESLKKYQNTTHLTLSVCYNNIKQEGIMLILSALQKCQKITNLNLQLSRSNVNLDLAKIIASALEKCQNITNLTLDLTKNNLSYGEQKVISDQLKYTLKNSKEITVEI